ncbi:MAG: isoprenylcysteine carboxylmethyltransferase family protein [Ignavibacteria bacterium]
MSFSEKWVNAIYKIVTGGNKSKYILTPTGGLIFVTFILSFIFLSFYLDRIFSFSDFLPATTAKITGLVLIIPGIIFSGKSIYIFIKSKGTPVPVNPPSELITDGIYGYSRNPMLAGLIMQLFGYGIFCNSITLTFIVSPVFMLLSIAELKFIEEPELEKRFGEKYISYKKSVPMFFPRIFKK